MSWTKDSDTVHLGWQRFHTQRDGTWLYVTDVQETDSGRYTCEATNGFGTASVTINLRVVRESRVLRHFRKLIQMFPNDLGQITTDTTVLYLYRLTVATPAHSALRLAVDTRAGGRSDNRPEWRRRRGRPCRVWMQQIEDDTGLNANDTNGESQMTAMVSEGDLRLVVG